MLSFYACVTTNSISFHSHKHLNFRGKDVVVLPSGDPSHPLPQSLSLLLPRTQEFGSLPKATESYMVYCEVVCVCVCVCVCFGEAGRPGIVRTIKLILFPFLLWFLGNSDSYFVI